MPRDKIAKINLSKEEKEELSKKAKEASMSQSALLRSLIKGYEPKGKIDDRFFVVMSKLSKISNELNELTIKADKLNVIDRVKFENLSKEFNQFENDIYRKFIRPNRREH